MSFIRRISPETIDTKQEALDLAYNKLNSLLPADNPLSAATSSRLATGLSQMNAKMEAVMLAKAAYNANTVIKNEAQMDCFIYASHFFQVFNLGVKRGVYSAVQRDFFKLPIDSDALPDMDKSADLRLWAKRIVDGDPLRITAGGAAMSNPTTAEVSSRYTNFNTLFTDQSNLKDALDAAQEALEAILPEIDRVIKKVWDELETFYNEESDESRRANCVEWGVVYETVGNEKVLSGTVTFNGAPAVGLVVHFKKGKNKSITSASGAYSLNTTLMNTQKIEINLLDENGEILNTWGFDVVLNEDGDKTQNFAVSG